MRSRREKGLIRAVRAFSLCIALSVLCGTSSREAAALPFNDDMVDIQPRTGSVVRSKPATSVSVGSLAFRVANRQEAEALENPVKLDAVSKMKGKRLFAVNCTPCHGDIAAKEWKVGPVGIKFGNIPDIRAVDPARQKDYRTQTDGFFYSVIHFGSMSTLMPAYGWKLSPTEHWDIVNYIRSVQGAS